MTNSRYKNLSEVIQTGIRLLEDEEVKSAALKKAIKEGISSGIAIDFSPKNHLTTLNPGDASVTKYVLATKAVADLTSIWEYTYEA